MRYYRLLSKSISQNPNPNSSISQLPISKNSKLILNTFFFARGLTSESNFVPSEKVSSIVNEISGLTLLEVSDLTELLRKKLDVKEMPAMGVMMKIIAKLKEVGAKVLME